MASPRVTSLAARVLACLAAGLLTTFAVSSGLAAWLPHRNLVHRLQFLGDEQMYADPIVAVERYSRPGMERRIWQVHRAELRRVTRRLWLDNRIVGDWFTDGPVTLHDTGSLWGGVGAIASGPGSGDGLGPRLEDARGWPLLAFWCEIEAMPLGSRPTSIRAKGCVAISSTDGSMSISGFRAIPLRPIWRGALTNTAFYTPFWLILLLGCPATRAWHRRRRGHCPSCAYDLRADLATGCPECGWRR